MAYTWEAEEEEPLLTDAAQVESIPFLLSRAPIDVPLAEDVPEGEPERARSVPPHAPPARTESEEGGLPSVIIDLRDLEASEEAEVRRASDVDGLLADAEVLEQTQVTRQPRRSRTFALTLVVAGLLAGSLIGARAHGVSPRAIGAALHLAR